MLEYRQVKDLYDTLAGAGVVTKSLPDWSREMNESLGTDLYSQGLEDNWVKRASVGVDKLLEATGLPAITEQVGRGFGELVGNPEAGASIGKSLPRTAASMLPFLIPGVGEVAGPISMGALAGTEAYTATGSPAAGITSGLLNLAMPKVADIAGQAALKGMGGQLVKGVVEKTGEEFSRYFPTNRLMGVAGHAAAQLGAGGLAVGSDVASDIVSGEPVHVSPTEQLLNLTLGQVPFAGMYLGKAGRASMGGRTTRAAISEVESSFKLTEDATNYKKNKEELDQKTRNAEVPPDGTESPPGDINALRGEKDRLKGEGGELAQDEWNALSDEENARVTAQGLVPGNITGSKLDSKVPRRMVFGAEAQSSEDGSWKAIKVADDPRNGDLAGKLISYDTANEIKPTETGIEGTLMYSVPERYHTELVEGEVPGRINPDATLKQAEDQLSAAKSLDEMQAAVLKLNAVRKAYGHAPVDDVTLAGRQTTWELGSQRDAIRASINETRRLSTEQDRSTVVDGLYTRKHTLETDRDTAELEGRTEDSLMRQKDVDDVQKEIDAFSVKSDVVDAEPPVGTKPNEVSPPVEAQIGPEPLPKVPDDVNGAPVRQFLYEQAVHITQATRNKTDRQAFLEYVKTGKLADEVAAKPHVRRWIGELNRATQDRPPTPRVAAEPLFQSKTAEDQAFVDGVGKTGVDLMGRLRTSTNPLVQKVVTTLDKFGDSLGRITVGVHDIDGPSYVNTNPDGSTRIAVAADLRHAHPEQQELLLAHEMMHGASKHLLDTNPEAATELGLLRMKVARKLPPELRTAIRTVEKTNWYENYGLGKAKWDDLVKLTGSDANARLVYGLLDNHEFLSQGFTDKGLQDHMKSKGMFGRFGEWVSKLLGMDIKPSEFEEFLSHSDKILGSGNFFASLHNYGERYFENLGLSADDARVQTARGIGVLHNLKFGEASADAILRGVQEQKSTNPVLRQSEAKLQEYMAGENGITPKALAEAKVTSVDELLTKLVRGEVDAETLKILDPEVTNYVYDKVRDMREVLGMLDSATTKGVENHVGVDASVGEPVRAALDKLSKFTNAERELIDDTARLQETNAINPDGYLNKGMRRPAPEPLYARPGEKPKETISWIEKFLGTPSYWARTSRSAAEIASKSRQLAANIRRSANSALEALGLNLKTGKFDAETLSAIDNPRVIDAANRWMYQNNAVGRERGEIKRLDRDSPQIAPILAKLSPEERKLAEYAVAKAQLAVGNMNEQIAGQGGFLENTAVNYGAKVIANTTKLKHEQNVQTAQTMLEHFMPRKDPATGQPIPVDPMMEQVKMQGLQQQLGMEAFTKLFNFMQDEARRIDMHLTFYTNHPAWATSRAYGKYDVEYKKGGRFIKTRVNSEAEAIGLAGGREHIVKDSFKPSGQHDDTYAMTWGDKEIEMLRGIENRNNAILDEVLSPEERAEHRLLSPSGQMEVEMAERRGVPEKPTLTKRGFTQGEEEFPWFRNTVEWITQTASYHSRQLLRAQARGVISEPEMMARPDLQAQMKKHIENVLRTDPEQTRNVTRFMSSWFLGMNPASMLMNGTQMLIRGAAEMTNMVGNPLESYRRIIKATKDTWEFHRTESGDTGSRFGWLKRKMDEDGLSSVYDEGDVGKDDSAMELKRRLYKLGPQSKGQKFAAINDAYNQKAMWGFKKVEKANNVIAMIAGWDYWRPKLETDMPGLSSKQLDQAAYDRAIEYNQSVNDIGGKANRSIGLFSGRDDFSKSAAMIMSSMQTYSIGTMGQIVSYIKKGGFKVGALKPGSEAYNANMALVQLLAVQTAAAGALGLPFVSGMMSVLDQAFPQLEVNKNVRLWASELFGGDEMMGSPIADAAMNGIPSMMGWDMQSRLSMGNMLPGTSELNGFQPAALLGPAFSIGKQAVGAVTSLAKGEYSQAAGNVAPPFLKKITNFALDGFRIRDYNDKPMFDATSGEVAGMILGFQPTRVSQENVANRVASNALKMENERNKKFYELMADDALKGRFGSIQQTLRQQIADKKYATNDQVRDAANSIADATVELQFPRDLRRGGGRSEEYAKTLRMFNLSPSLPTEEARLQFKARVMQGIGFPLKRQDIERAQMVDQLRLKYPKMTRYELTRQAEAVLGRKSAALPQASLPSL